MKKIYYESWIAKHGKLYIGLQDASNGYAADLEMLSTLVKEVKE